MIEKIHEHLDELKQYFTPQAFDETKKEVLDVEARLKEVLAPYLNRTLTPEEQNEVNKIWMDIISSTHFSIQELIGKPFFGNIK